MLLDYSFAIFTEDKEFNVINGTYQDPGDIYFAYYVDGQITRELPKQDIGYIFDEEKSSCTNGVVPIFDHSTWKFTADYSGYNATDYTRTKCNLYFTKTKTVNTVLGNLEVYTYTPDFTKSACDDEVCGTHEKGIFETTDENGPTYYYRGSVENNYVSFAGYYWRIIRINGDGSIRMIYDGTEAHENGTGTPDRYYNNFAFGTNGNDNMYVGYMYTNDEVHGLENSSVVKTANDNFYTVHMSSYSSYIATNIDFCGDRTTLNLITTAGTGATTTYYAGYLRIVETTPTLECENASDYYTVSLSNTGNKSLAYPIGLITADEALMAGIGGGVVDGTYNHGQKAPNNYLTIARYNYWTMTPSGGYNPYGGIEWVAYVFTVSANGVIDDNRAPTGSGLRPVINIRSDVTVTGDGTMSNPYRIS